MFPHACICFIAFAHFWNHLVGARLSWSATFARKVRHCGHGVLCSVYEIHASDRRHEQPIVSALRLYTPRNASCELLRSDEGCVWPAPPLVLWVEIRTRHHPGNDERENLRVIFRMPLVHKLIARSNVEFAVTTQGAFSHGSRISARACFAIQGEGLRSHIIQTSFDWAWAVSRRSILVFCKSCLERFCFWHLTSGTGGRGCDLTSTWAPNETSLVLCYLYTCMFLELCLICFVFLRGFVFLFKEIRLNKLFCVVTTCMFD